MIELIHGDCLEKMGGGVKSHSIDLVLTDPPYNISRTNNFTSMGRAGIDFGEWDKGADITSWLYELPRILTPNGSAIIFNSWHNLAEISDVCENIGFVVKDVIRWIKTNPMPRNRDRRYITDYEFALWVTNKKAKWTFNRQNTSYQRPEFHYPTVQGKEKTIHPTQKPVSLMEELLRIHTEPNMTVLDPFMGSGSTGVACKNLNRNFIGIELDKKYFDIAYERIN